MAQPDPLRRILSRVDRTGDCWLWTGGRNRGYGKTSIAGQQVYVHRAVYEFIVGPIPADLELDHLCRVRHCVRPDHLEVVTQAVNIERGISPSAVNARKDRCERGHPFSAENTYVPPSGRRVCRTCKNAWTRQRRKAGRASCANGHPLTGGNVKVKANGTRMCLQCMAVRQRGGAHDSRFRHK